MEEGAPYFLQVLILKRVTVAPKLCKFEADGEREAQRETIPTRYSTIEISVWQEESARL
jgi:hypothetical protein